MNACAEVAAADSTNPTLRTTWTGAKQETEMVLFTSIEQVLTKLNLHPKEVRLTHKKQRLCE